MPLDERGHRPGGRGFLGRDRARGGRRPGCVLRRMNDFTPGSYEWPSDAALRHKEKFQKALRPQVPHFAAHEAIDVVREVTPRIGGNPLLRRGRAHAPNSQPVDGARPAHLPHHERVVLDGLRPARRHRRETRMSRQTRRRPHRGRVFPDDVRRGGRRQENGARHQPIVVLDDRWLSLIQVKQELGGITAATFFHREHDRSLQEYHSPRASITTACSDGVCVKTTGGTVRRALPGGTPITRAGGPTGIEAVVVLPDAGFLTETSTRVLLLESVPRSESVAAKPHFEQAFLSSLGSA